MTPGIREICQFTLQFLPLYNRTSQLFGRDDMVCELGWEKWKFLAIVNIYIEESELGKHVFMK